MHFVEVVFGTSVAILEGKLWKDKMDSSSKTRKPHQGPCICDDCGKRMQWKGIDWCFTDSGYLLCSSCLLVWVKESRYHKMDKSKQMSMIKILDINAPFIREASSANFEEDLNHEIETKLAGLEVKGLPYERADIIELISSIETENEMLGRRD